MSCTKYQAVPRTQLKPVNVYAIDVEINETINRYMLKESSAANISSANNILTCINNLAELMGVDTFYIKLECKYTDGVCFICDSDLFKNIKSYFGLKKSNWSRDCYNDYSKEESLIDQISSDCDKLISLID